MQKLSSSLFMLALLVYYLPKIFKFKMVYFRKAHIAIGGVSILAMCIALIQKFGTTDFIKYIGFTSIMVSIGITGCFFMKKRGVARILHIVSTIGFFVYLFLSIKLL